MSNAFPNMFPNEPPPLDPLDEEDEAEEEGYGYANYSATGLKLDILADSSPMSSPQRKLPVPRTPEKFITPENPNPHEDHNVMVTPTSIVNGTSENQNKNKLEEDELLTPNSDSNDLDELSPVQVKNPYSDSETSSHKIISVQDEFGDFIDSSGRDLCVNEAETQSESPTEEINFPIITNSSSSDEQSIEAIGLQMDSAIESPVPGYVEDVISIASEYEDLEGESQGLSNKSRNVSPTPEFGNDDFEEFQTEIVQEKISNSSPNLEVEDEFGDFSKALPSEQESVSRIAPATELDDDEFGDFSGEVIPVQKFPKDVARIPAANTIIVDAFECLPSKLVLTPEAAHCLYPETELEDDDDFGDFHCSNLNVTPRTPYSEPTTVVAPKMSLQPLKTSFVGVVENLHVEEFVSPTRPELSSREWFPIVHSNATPLPSKSIAAIKQKLDEDFGDFLGAQQNYEVHAPIAFTRKDSQVETRFDSLVSSVFRKPSTAEVNSLNPFTLRGIDKELDGKSNSAWAHVQDFEDSHGLKFKWPISNAHRHLLKSLKVDTSAIVYTDKWGAIEVPKFATSLGDIPLQPAALSQPTPTPSTSSSEFQEFQSHKSAMNTISPDANHCSASKNMTINNTEREISQTGLAQISDLSYKRTELVFPSTPMFDEY